MNNKQSILIVSMLSLLTWGCADDNLRTSSEENGKYPLCLHAEINQVNVTRANDMGFADGDRIGLYMVDFDNDVPQPLQPDGNHADNVSYTYNEESCSWESPTPLGFKDSSTPADLYGYYPYIQVVEDVEAIPFSVEKNQSREMTSDRLSGYEASDLLWAKASGLSAASPDVTLTFNHILSGIEVNLIEGQGFEEGEWNSLQKSILIAGTKRDGIFDIRTGMVTAKDNKDNQSIIANPHGYGFRAVVIPQTIGPGCNLMYINVGSDSYGFSRSEGMEYKSGKLHKFTFEVSKKLLGGVYEFTLLDEVVTMWESDPTSHDGLGRAYMVVEVGKGETLQDALKEANLTAEDIVNLKLTGHIAADDFFYIRDNMRKIEALNLKDVIIEQGGQQWYGYEYEANAIPRMALTNSVTLKHIVLPDKLVKIGELAFGGTILEGSLKIPEGVKYIGNSAFTNYWAHGAGNSEIPGGKLLANNNLTGTLELPSSLEFIGADAFRNCNFSGNLILPNSLRHLGSNAFSGCRNFNGSIHLPDNLTDIEKTYFDWVDGCGAFSGIHNFVGDLELPKNLKVINGFGGMEVSNILFPEGALEIGEAAFLNTRVKSGIDIPESVSNIESYAFYGCTAPYIRLPKSLTRISTMCFEKCRNLSDTMTIPANVEIIDERAFRECSKVSALVLPAKLNYIAGWAFENCYSLEYIRCDAKEPPYVHESAFDGIAKDNFTLEVPEGTVDAYRNHPIWGEFKRIAAYRNFVARPSKFNVLNKGGKKEIVLNADGEWEISSCPDWCHIDKKTGNKKTILNLTVDEMAHGHENRTGTIVFRLTGDGDYHTHINVGQYDYEYEEDSYVDLQKASKGSGIELFLLGDGYDAKDISSGLMMKDLRRTMEYFFAVEPYTTYREYFNVKVGITLSEDSGIEEINRWRTTKFHTVIPCRCGKGFSTDWMSALDYTAEICPSLLDKPNPRVGVIMLANYDGYGGVTYTGDSFCSLVTKSDKNYPYDSRGLVQHEAGGHGIGWLADEYIYHNSYIQKCSCSCCDHVEGLVSGQQTGFGLNLSLDGKYDKVGWSHLIFNPSYGDIVDIYEGGYFHSRGVYRSEYNSCMNNNVPYFSTWSRQLIVQRIMKLAGESFSLEQFFANDKRDMGRDFTVTRSTSSQDTEGPRGQAPVFIKNYKFGKKGGRK